MLAWISMIWFKQASRECALSWPWVLTEQRPERPHRSGDIQKGKLPIVLENQFCSGTCIYLENNVTLNVFFGFRIYIYLLILVSFTGQYILASFLFPTSAGTWPYISNEILNLKQKWEKCTARKATPDKVIFCLGFSCNFTYICLTDHANANVARWEDVCGNRPRG